MCAVRVITSETPEKSPTGFDLSQYPTEFLMCRSTMRHTLPPLTKWRWTVLRSITGRVIEATATTQCETCKAIVQDTTNGQNGTKVRHITRPTLPQVYRIPKAAGVTTYDLRIELLSRITPGQFDIETDTVEDQAIAMKENQS